MTKRSEFLRDNELKLLHAKNLILEEDLCQKKKEYEQEKANTIFKLDQTIKEKGLFFYKIIKKTYLNNNNQEIMDINLKSTSDKLKMISEEKKILLLKFESLQAKTKGNENEFKFKYEELKNELENKFNDIREENIHVQNENDKKIALLAQENQFLNKENERSRKDSEEKNNEISNLKLDLETSCYENENLKKDLNEIEIRKQKELYCLKNEFEKKIKEVHFYNLILKLLKNSYLSKIRKKARIKINSKVSTQIFL